MALITSAMHKYKVKMTLGNRRGPHFTLIFAVSSMKCGEIIEMDPIKSWDLAEFRFKFTMDFENNCTLQPCVKFKRGSKAKDYIGVKIRSAHFRKQSVCGDDWSEYINMGPPQNTDSCRIPCLTKHEHPFLLIFKVNITVKDLTPKPLSINKRLFTDMAFTDFELQGEDGTVACHKAILVTHSTVFRAMLKRDWQETSKNSMIIKASKQTLQYLKEYMYLRTLPNDVIQLQHLLSIAEMYLVDNLKFRSIEKMVELVTPENFDQVIEYACKSHVPDLIKALVISTPDKTVDGIIIRNYLKVAPAVEGG